MAKYITKREAAQRRAWLRALSGVFDFFGSVASFVIILITVALISTLFAWVKGDIPATFETIKTVIQSAIVQPDQMN
ncbi:MAG: hypothetical protein ACOYI8_03005 [Christensenellales bacterium]|jgi:hypothetical protein